MEPATRRDFLQQAAAVAGGGLLLAAGLSLEARQQDEPSRPMHTDPATSTTFDPQKHLVVPSKTFKDLKVGDVFRAPGRTLTEAHAAAFQTVSCDNHPVHYDAE